MRLRYIYCGVNQDIQSLKIFERKYFYASRFICHYLTRRIRAYKFETDGSFNCVSIELGSDEPCKIVSETTLNVFIPFDIKRFVSVYGTTDYSYYIENLRNGFHKASKFRKIPEEILNQYLDEFIAGGCINEWLYFKKAFSNSGIRMEIKATFSTFRLKLEAEFYRIYTRSLLCKGIIKSTKPDEFFIYNDHVDGERTAEFKGKILYYDRYDSYHMFEFYVKDILNGNFRVVLNPDWIDNLKIITPQEMLEIITFKPDNPNFNDKLF